MRARHRIGDSQLNELIANRGKLESGPVSRADVERLALDLEDCQRVGRMNAHIIGEAVLAMREVLLIWEEVKSEELGLDALAGPVKMCEKALDEFDHLRDPERRPETGGRGQGG